MENKTPHRLSLCSAAILLGGFFASAESVSHSVGVNVRPSYIIPTHGFYNGWNPTGKALRVGGSVHADYAFSYPDSYLGVGIGVQTFLAHEALGTPVSLYVFQGAPVAGFSDRLTLDYEWNLGLSAGWKPDEEYMLTGSRLNIYINVGLFLHWRLNKDWDLQMGPEYTHYSNGDTVFPNGGANTVNFRIGARRFFGRVSAKAVRPSVFSSADEELPFARRVTYDLTAFGAWRADRMIIGSRLHIINEAFLTAGLQFNPLYHFNGYLSAGPSLDLLYDRSANLNASVDEEHVLTYSSPAFINQCAAGISVRGELKMPIFAVNIGIGYNFSRRGSDLRGIYGIFALKAFVTDSIFLNIGYRLSTVLYSHNLMFGLGWRFGA